MSSTPILATAVALLLVATPLAARESLTPMQADIDRTLPTFGFTDVDVTSLSTGQLAHIHHLLYSNKSPAQIRGNIGAILGDSLFKTLFK